MASLYLTVFAASFLGSFVGVMLAGITLLYLVKKKLSNNPLGAMM